MTIREIEEALEEGEGLKTIAQAYSEIANLKIKKIRGLVERNRYFFQEISKVYGLIKKLAEQKKVSYKKPRGIVSVILTSNYRFYGSINSDLIEFFISTTKKINTDIILLGRAAVDYFKANHIFKNYQQILLKDDQPNASELTEIINLINPYNQVLIFHSRLKSLLTQKSVVTDITATSAPISHLEGGPGLLPGGEQFRFIFEPELSKILAFFDSQILTLTLESTFLESELSRTASRFISMDSAENEANKFIDEYEKLKSFTQRSLVNNQVLENFATIATSRKGVLT